MAEFKEVMEQRSRMCKHYLSTDISCENCPLDKARKNTMFQCFRYVAEYYQEAENVIMEWAVEHPEPQYPTWTEWLSKQGFVELKAGQFVKQTENEYVYECKTVAILTDKAAVPIPADIAEKLGVEQREV